MIAWFSIAPDDGSGSYSKHVAAALEMIRGPAKSIASSPLELNSPQPLDNNRSIARVRRPSLARRYCGAFVSSPNQSAEYGYLAGRLSDVCFIRRGPAGWHARACGLRPCVGIVWISIQMGLRLGFRPRERENIARQNIASRREPVFSVQVSTRPPGV
jgi:hypothetical protein